MGDSIFKFVHNFFTTNTIPLGVNETLSVLIPKCDGPSRLIDFKPISLCNVIYKVVTKLIANRCRLVMRDLVGEH